MYLVLIVDSCFTPLMVRANFNEYGRDSWVAYFFNNGRYSDFNDEWYQVVGSQLFATLILMSIRPVIEMAFEILAVKIKRSMKDRNYKHHTNNYSDALKYEEMFAAPEYNFHKKIASINATVFITIVFGIAFPIMYIVCIFAFFVKYVVERFTLARFYRLPKKHSQLLTDQMYRI